MTVVHDCSQCRIHTQCLMIAGKMTFNTELSSTGHFVISSSGNVLSEGEIKESKEERTDHVPLSSIFNEGIQLKQEDVYQEFRVRGYDYGPLFQTIKSFHLEGKVFFHRYSDHVFSVLYILQKLASVLGLPLCYMELTMHPSKLVRIMPLIILLHYSVTAKLKQHGSRLESFHFEKTSK